MDRISNISGEAVRNATGRGWEEWLEVLDEAGAKKLTHVETVKIVAEKGVASGWWQQMVTAVYERARGKRITGQTENAGFEVGVQRTIPISQEEAWKLINSSKGRAIWAGDADIEVRTQKRGERFRLNWKERGKERSVLQISLSCPRNTVDRTTVRFHHERLADAKEREEMRKHWKGVIDRLYRLNPDTV